MIKECLNALLERDFKEPTLPPMIKNIMENFDNDQIFYMLQNGMKISKDLTLFYYQGQGFRCMNDNAQIIGNKPICGVIERSLNKKILKS